MKTRQGIRHIAEAQGEVLPGNPGVVFVPNATAIAKALEKEGGDEDEEDIHDFRAITDGAHVAVGVRRANGSDHRDGTGGNHSK